MDDLLYCVDENDRLERASDSWDLFAAANDGQALLWERVEGRSLWDFVSDPTTRGLYSDLLARVRAGRPVTFPFRCDSPGHRRFLRMDMRPAAGGRVEFLVRAEAIEPRPLQPLPAPGGMLRVCGWCRRVAAPGGWLELEDAARELGLFERARLPRATHGICGPCERRVNEALGS